MAKNINVGLEISAIDKASAPLARISANLSSLGKSVQSVSRLGVALDAVGAATAAIGAAMGARMGINFTKGVIETSAKFEDFAATLETTEGSSVKAQKALDWVEKFATQTPYEVADVTEAFVKMRAYGLEPTNGLMQTLGDTASAMGKPLMQAVEAIADAVTGENERLKEFGIKAAKSGGKIAYTYTDAAGKQQKKTVDANNRAMIQSTLQGIFNARYKGAMEKRSKTWNGMMSNISDMWTSFQRMIGSSGVFDFAKSRMKSLLDMFFKMNESGELRKLADSIGKFLTSAMVAAEGAAMRFWGVIKQWADPMGTAKDSADVVTLALGKLQATVSSAFSAIGSFVDAVGGWGNVFIAFGVIITASVVAPLAALLIALGPVGVAVAAFAGLAAVLLAKWTIAADGLKGVWADITGGWDKFTTSIGDVGRALGIMSGPLQQPTGIAAPSAAKAAAPAASKSTVDLNVMLKSEDGSLARVGNVKTKGKGVNLSVDNGPSMAGFGSGF